MPKRTLSSDELRARIERRARGEADALDDCWADDTISWRSFDLVETRSSGASRETLSRRELEAFRAAIPDFERRSEVHLSESTNTVFELSSWTGSGPQGPVHVELCLAYRIEHGRIARVEMWADGAQMSALTAAVHASRR